MTYQTRKHLTVWLGLLAMWLVVFAPVISQLAATARAHEPVAVLCSAVQSGDTEHHSQTGSLAACGYCDLLATHAAVPSVPPAALSMLVLIAIATAPILSICFTPLDAFPSGRPRDPPSVA